jgi:SAM-dependent methyltransferase
VSTLSPKYFYTADSWDESDWLDIVSIEYESLVSAYPFDTKFREISNGGRLSVLDVGCGSALFARYLEPTLGGGIQLTCDLLDVSERSLQQAHAVLEGLEHFSPGRSIQTLIEDIPEANSLSGSTYDVIWAIHSLTTVDVDLMPSVFRHLLQLLSDDGRLYIYQLTADSSYQTLHRAYRERRSKGVPPFMEFENTERIIKSLPVDYEVLELSFDHELQIDQPDLVEHYLRKCVLDESIDALRVFGDVLARFESDGLYRIPQSVNFISVSKR